MHVPHRTTRVESSRRGEKSGEVVRSYASILELPQFKKQVVPHSRSRRIYSGGPKGSSNHPSLFTYLMHLSCRQTQFRRVSKHIISNLARIGRQRRCCHGLGKNCILVPGSPSRTTDCHRQSHPGPCRYAVVS
jgi:hypothetical protein